MSCPFHIQTDWSCCCSNGVQVLLTPRKARPLLVAVHHTRAECSECTATRRCPWLPGAHGEGVWCRSPYSAEHLLYFFSNALIARLRDAAHDCLVLTEKVCGVVHLMVQSIFCIFFFCLICEAAWRYPWMPGAHRKCVWCSRIRYVVPGNSLFWKTFKNSFAVALNAWLRNAASTAHYCLAQGTTV